MLFASKNFFARIQSEQYSVVYITIWAGVSGVEIVHVAISLEFSVLKTYHAQTGHFVTFSNIWRLVVEFEKISQLMRHLLARKCCLLAFLR